MRDVPVRSNHPSQEKIIRHIHAAREQLSFALGLAVSVRNETERLNLEVTYPAGKASIADQVRDLERLEAELGTFLLTMGPCGSRVS